MHAENFIILISLTILISYISSLVYSLTKIPDVIVLMGFGILMGPVLGYADKIMFDEIAPLMSILALSIIRLASTWISPCFWDPWARHWCCRRHP
jgi:uncharacterized membrane protein (Fun14 family)